MSYSRGESSSSVLLLSRALPALMMFVQVWHLRSSGIQAALRSLRLCGAPQICGASHLELCDVVNRLEQKLSNPSYPCHWCFSSYSPCFWLLSAKPNGERTSGLSFKIAFEGRILSLLFRVSWIERVREDPSSPFIPGFILVRNE